MKISSLTVETDATKIAGGYVPLDVPSNTSASGFKTVKTLAANIAGPTGPTGPQGNAGITGPRGAGGSQLMIYTAAASGTSGFPSDGAGGTDYAALDPNKFYLGYPPGSFALEANLFLPILTAYSAPFANLIANKVTPPSGVRLNFFIYSLNDPSKWVFYYSITNPVVWSTAVDSTHKQLGGGWGAVYAPGTDYTLTGLWNDGDLIGIEVF